jgi:aspartate 1-decarboxylase
MMLTMLKSKIHRATVTQANLNYVGSITIDKNLMQAANIQENEQVHIVDIDNGNRLETYVIEGEAGSGMMCLNGAAARLVQAGDKIIIMCYCQVTTEEAKSHKPDVVFVNDENEVVEITYFEKHGEIK